MNTNYIIQKFKCYYKKQNFQEFQPLSLIDESFPTTYVPSAGEPHLVKLLKKGEIYERKDFIVNQPCFRSVDINRVGNDFHLSFFEMLGAFSFIPTTILSDLPASIFFKKEQIKHLSMCFEFLLSVLKIPKERIWVTVFGGDSILRINKTLEKDQTTLDFLKQIGIKNVILKGIPDNYLIRLLKDQGDYTRPESIVLFGDTTHELSPYPDINAYSGKRIEIFYDRGSKYHCGRKECKPTICNCQRFVELATCAFLDKYVIKKEGKFDLVDSKHFIFYSAYGVERLSMVTENKPSIYYIDKLEPIVQLIENYVYNFEESFELWIRRITDYIRGIVFIIAAGDKPSNRGRGYVLRRILRRVLLYLKLLGITEPKFFEILVSKIISIYGVQYPYLKNAYKDIIRIILDEQECYEKTLQKAINRLRQYIDKRKTESITFTKNELEKFSNTYGMPKELVKWVIDHYRTQNLDKK